MSMVTIQFPGQLHRLIEAALLRFNSERVHPIKRDLRNYLGTVTDAEEKFTVWLTNGQFVHPTAGSVELGEHSFKCIVEDPQESDQTYNVIPYERVERFGYSE